MLTKRGKIRKNWKGLFFQKSKKATKISKKSAREVQRKFRHGRRTSLPATHVDAELKKMEDYASQVGVLH